MILRALVSTLFPFTILSGAVYQLKSFVVTILAGLGKPFGALVAGVLLGLLEEWSRRSSPSVGSR